MSTMASITNTGGGGSSGGDDLIDTGFDLEDDLEIVLLDDDVSTPLRGQNESAEGDDDLLDGANPDDLSDPKFQEQLSQERRLRADAERAALDAQERADAALLASEKRNIAIQKDSFRLALDGVDVRIRTATEALKMARQDDDHNAETDLEAQLNELRALRTEITAGLGKLPDESSLDREFENHIRSRRARVAAQTRASQGDDPRPLNPKAAQWTKTNAWMNDPAKTKEKAALMETNNALAAEGYDPNTDEFFTELSRRMAKRFPSLGVKNFNGAGVGAQARQGRVIQNRNGAPPVAAARSAAPPTEGAKRLKGRVQLDNSDVRMMRMLRIDPKDADAVKRYAAEKYQRLTNEQRASR